MKCISSQIAVVEEKVELSRTGSIGASPISTVPEHVEGEVIFTEVSSTGLRQDSQ